MEYKGIAPDPARFFIGISVDRPRVLAFDSRATFALFHRYGAEFFRALFESDPSAPEPEKGKPRPLRIKDVDAFEFFLWAGLQRDAKAAGESLALEDVSAMILPTTISDLADALLVALAATQQPRKEATKNA